MYSFAIHEHSSYKLSQDFNEKLRLRIDELCSKQKPLKYEKELRGQEKIR